MAALLPAAAPGASAEDLGLRDPGVPAASFLDRLGRSGFLDPAGNLVDLSEDRKVAIIRLAYEHLEDRTAGGGSDLSFDLSEFEFVYRDGFVGTPYADVMTLPGGPTIHLRRSRRGDDEAGGALPDYTASWVALSEPPAWLRDRALAGGSIAEALAVLRPAEPHLAAAESVSTYRVTASLNGQVRAYRAAFFWAPPRPGRAINFFAMDHVSPGVATMIYERPARLRIGDSPEPVASQSVGPAEMAPFAFSLDGEHVIRAPEDPSFLEEVRLLIQGTPDELGGCLFSSEIVLDKGEQMAERVVEFDPYSCEFIVARGTIDRSIDVDRSPAGPLTSHGSSRSLDREAELEDAPPEMALRTPPTCSDLIYEAAQARQWIYFEDPIFLNVTESDMEVGWAYDYECVQSLTSVYTSRWLVASGWQLTSHTHDAYYENEFRAVAEGRSSMINPIFCWVVFRIPGVTFNDYNPNLIRVFGDGRVTYTYNAWASGVCSNLLSLRREVSNW